ncbi:hypothetical protein [Candidatus Palauibacter sp.]|uniref:hypothetical protein n=1 Tax=Candidatus Palauibacter sp. TaxID=3101350 RepID=UPI003B5B2829
MEQKIEIVEGANYPPPIPVDGCVLSVSRDRILIHLLTVTPALSDNVVVLPGNQAEAEVADGKAERVPANSMDCKVHVSVLLDFPTAALFAEQLAAAAQFKVPDGESS